MLAAVADSLYTPLLKLISADAWVAMSVAFIFFGAGCGSLLILLFGRKSKAIFDPERHLRKNDTGKIIIFILLSLLASFLITIGIQQESAAASSVLQNVTIVATVLFAAIFLREKISKRLGIGVVLIILGSISLAVTNPTLLSFSTGSLFIIAGCIVLGVLYLISKLLADRNPVECNIIRGFSAGVIALIIAFSLGDALPSVPTTLGLMATGFIGSSITPILMMYGQRHLGAAKTGAIFGIYPLIGVFISIPLLGEMPSASLFAALILFIPGMYFVITKNSGKTAAEAKQRDEPKREDAEYLPYISEEKKTGMKNQLTSFGLLLIAMFFVTMVLDIVDQGASDAPDVFSAGLFIPGLTLSICLFLIGIILLILGKRVLTAVTFILMVPQMLSFVILGDIPVMAVLSGSFSIIFALILLTSKSQQKYAFAAVNVLLGAAFISNLFSSIMYSIIVSIASVFLIWLAFVCGTGKLRRSISKHLTEDGDITFSRWGAVIGFLLLAKNMTTTFIYYYVSDSSIYALDSMLFLGIIYTSIIAFVGAALIFIGKRRMTAVFFFGEAIILSLELLSDGMFMYLPVIFSLIFAVLIIVLGRSLILPTLLLISDAFTTLLYMQLDAFPEVQTAMLLLSLTCAAIALYLSFAVVSKKPKLPVF
ncbi:MAG: DMT family transporter [Methanocorpusculum sp.]|nr:DMT family transporter [Methanocorpusculum sp.]